MGQALELHQTQQMSIQDLQGEHFNDIDSIDCYGKGWIGFFFYEQIYELDV
jgi:hypothetical protein